MSVELTAGGKHKENEQRCIEPALELGQSLCDRQVSALKMKCLVNSVKTLKKQILFFKVYFDLFFAQTIFYSQMD